jgi:hypothetical protein
MLRWVIAGLFLVASLLACPVDEGNPDATGLDAEVAAETSDPILPRADNPFLGGLDASWDCERKVCQPGEDPYLEMKSWTQSHPDCEPIPVDLLCRLRSQSQGTDWPAAQDAAIQAASAASGGFTATQIQALKCLGALDSVNLFGVYSWTESEVPESIRPDALITLDESLDKRTAFERAFGPAIGVALAIGPEYSFRPNPRTRTLTWQVESWKGIAIDGSLHVEAEVDSEPSWGPTDGMTCPGRFRLVSIQTNLSRAIEKVDVVPTITLKQAESIAIEGGCWFGNAEYAVRKTQLVVSKDGLFWSVRVMCQVQESCGSFDVPFDVRVEAHSGVVISKMMDAAIDCF